jgi:RNA polymerase sigma factor (sigma-70 family)
MLSKGAIENEEEYGGAAEEPFERSLAPLRDDLARYCRSVTGNRWDAEDLLQETVMKAYIRYVHTGAAEFKKSYLYRIASNAWIDRLRKKREVAVSDEGAVWNRLQTSERHRPFDELTNLRWAVEHILECLPPKQRTALLLTEALGFSIEEAARSMGIAQGAVKSLLWRGRERLARHRDDETDAGAVDAIAVDAYLRAIRTGDARAIVTLGKDQPQGTMMSLGLYLCA